MATTTTLLEFAATLLHPAQVRADVLDDGHTVPVLVLDAVGDGPARPLLTLRQHYPAGMAAQAEAAARQYPAGTRVQVQVPVLGLHLHAPITHIHQIPHPASAPAAAGPSTPTTTTPELF